MLGPGDLRGRLREKLLDLAHAARPGRPVLYGGTGNREVLLDAINNWRVFRVVPESPRPFLLADAIRKAQEALELECGLEQAAAELRDDTRRLEEAVDDLRASQERTRHAERLSTLGRITKSLIPVIGEHLDALSEFSALVASGSGRRDVRLEELLAYAFTGIRSLHAMLDEIRGYAESRSETYELQPIELDEVVRLASAFCRYDPLAAQRRLVAELRAQGPGEGRHLPPAPDPGEPGAQRLPGLARGQRGHGADLRRPRQRLHRRRERRRAYPARGATAPVPAVFHHQGRRRHGPGPVPVQGHHRAPTRAPSPAPAGQANARASGSGCRDCPEAAGGRSARRRGHWSGNNQWNNS